jgi:hypothetical protein
MIDCSSEQQKDESIAVDVLRTKADISLTFFSFHATVK